MNINQDVTPFERMDDALLEQLLGIGKHAADADMSVRDATPRMGGTGLNCRGEREDSRAWQPSVPAAMTEQGCGKSCGGAQGDMHGCGVQESSAFGVHGGILAALYIPVQPFDDLYDEDTALSRGTMFRALDLPFVGGKGGNCYDRKR